jgi:hypothetical protein
MRACQVHPVLLLVVLLVLAHPGRRQRHLGGMGWGLHHLVRLASSCLGVVPGRMVLVGLRGQHHPGRVGRQARVGHLAVHQAWQLPASVGPRPSSCHRHHHH